MGPTIGWRSRAPIGRLRQPLRVPQPADAGMAARRPPRHLAHAPVLDQSLGAPHVWLRLLALCLGYGVIGAISTFENFCFTTALICLNVVGLVFDFYGWLCLSIGFDDSGFTGWIVVGGLGALVGAFTHLLLLGWFCSGVAARVRRFA